MQPTSESPVVAPSQGRAATLLRGADPWMTTGVAVVVLCLVVGLVDAVLGEPGDRATLGAILVLGSVGLVCALRHSLLTAVVAALLVGSEVRDVSPAGTWAVAGGLLFMFALRRDRLEAVAAGVLFAGAGVLGDVRWGAVVDGGVIGLMTLAAAMVALGQWVQAQHRYVVAEVGRRREESERRREEVARRLAEERLRIARDLHDSVAHHFAVVSVQANLARASLASSPSDADRALQSVQLASRSVLEELQLVLGVLRGEAAEPADVPVDRIHDLASSYREIGLEVEASGLEAFPLLPAPTRAAVYRLLQEAFTNAHRYGDGRATLAFGVGVGIGDEYVTVTVSNALGSSPSAAAGGGGLGLIGMRERVAGLGGTLVAGPDEHGFVVRARLPLTLAARGGVHD